MRALEGTVKQQGDRLTVIEARGNEGQCSQRRYEEQARYRDQNGHDSLARHESITVHPDGIQDPSESMTDGMAISFVDDEDCGFFGPSSNMAFMRHIFRAMSTRGIASQPSPSSPSSGVHRASIMRITSASARDPDDAPVEANVLPADAHTRELMGAYFSNTGLLFPFIHEQTFLETYELMRRGDDSHRAGIRRTWLGLLNMVLAMAVCTSDQVEDSTEGGRPSESDVYYRRARELCKMQMLRGTTLETGTSIPNASRQSSPG